jgi:hypothetical protein
MFAFEILGAHATVVLDLFFHLPPIGSSVTLALALALPF